MTPTNGTVSVIKNQNSGNYGQVMDAPSIKQMSKGIDADRPSYPVGFGPLMHVILSGTTVNSNYKHS